MKDLILLNIGSYVLIGILFLIIYICIIWTFIKSAVKAGTKEAIEEILKNKNITLSEQPKNEFQKKESQNRPDNEIH